MIGANFDTSKMNKPNFFKSLELPKKEFNLCNWSDKTDRIRFMMFMGFLD